MKRKRREAVELEAELLRLNELVRARRAQLARLRDCPNPDCPCRAVWRDHVERNLATQVGKIRREVHGPRRPTVLAKENRGSRRRQRRQ